jgi:hypothetical protein
MVSCPEFTFLGLNRPPMTYEEYNTPEYRQHCRKILAPVLDQAKEYLKKQLRNYRIIRNQRQPFMRPFQGHIHGRTVLPVCRKSNLPEHFVVFTQ